MTSVMGTTKSAAAGLNFMPSIADSTEIAGVMTPSPYSNAAPMIPSKTTIDSLARWAGGS